MYFTAATSSKVGMRLFAWIILLNLGIREDSGCSCTVARGAPTSKWAAWLGASWIGQRERSPVEAKTEDNLVWIDVVPPKQVQAKINLPATNKLRCPTVRAQNVRQVGVRSDGFGGVPRRLELIYHKSVTHGFVPSQVPWMSYVITLNQSVWL
jgi:hypothetical protein